MKRSILALSVAAAVTACSPDLTVPNLNDPSAGGAVTRSTIVADAQGLLDQLRQMATQGVRFTGVLGRESYDLRPQEPRPYSDYLIGPRDPNSFGATAFFGTNYTAIVNARTTIADVAGVSDMTAEEKAAVRGWAQIVEAYAYAQLAMFHPGFGAPLEPPADPTGELAPVATQQQLFDRAFALYDSAQAHLQQAGSGLPFSLLPGSAGFSTPAGLIQLDRALKARVLKYNGKWADVLAALQSSFLDTSKPSTSGAWLDYGSESPNPFSGVPTDYIHPRIRAEAQTQPDGSPDKRVPAKLKAIAPYTFQEATASDVPNVYPSATSPFPLIKNEELILLRAEAELAQGNTAAALADVNVVRQGSGGLAPLAAAEVPTNDALLDEILYEKRYSLLWEGGFTWLDALQYAKLDLLPKAAPDHVVFDRLGWPSNECLARGLSTGACGTVVGK